MSQAGRFISGQPAPGTVLFLEGDTGGPVGPTLAGIINVVGGVDVTVDGNPVDNTLTINLTGSIANTYVSDSGTATPALGILNVNGAGGIQTTASGNTIIIETNGGIATTYNCDNSTSAVPSGGILNVTGGTSGAVFTGSGNTITESFKFLAMSDSTPTTGYIKIGGSVMLAAWGGVSQSNTFVGESSGNSAVSGSTNTAIGSTSLVGITSGILNCAMGSATLGNLTSGRANTAIGTASLFDATTTTGNSALGYESLENLVTGSFNIGIGYQSAQNYTGSESSNIIIGNLGTLGESNHIRIGTQGSGSGQQNACNIAGIYGSTVGGTNAAVFIDNAGNLGTSGGSGGVVTSITGNGGGGSVTGAVTLTGGTSGAIFTDSGGNTITESFNFLALPNTNAGATQGVITLGGTVFMNNFGTNNAFFGNAGNTSVTGMQNVGIGSSALSALTSGSQNMGIGSNALQNVTTGQFNTAIGVQAGGNLIGGSSNSLIGLNAGFNLTSGSNNILIGLDSGFGLVASANNVAIGFQAGFALTGDSNTIIGTTAAFSLTSGSSNTIIGFFSGTNYTSSESSNVLISNVGTVGESNVIRIGTQGAGTGQQDACYIAGITGSSVGATNALVYCDNTGKLGTTGGTFPSLGTTNHAVQVGNSSGGLTSLSVGTNGQVLVGSSGADPIFATLTSSGSSITYTTGAGSLNIDITSPVSIAHGGTNATSMATVDGTVYYDGTRLVTTATGTAGQVLTSNGAGVAPTYQSLTSSGVTSLTGTGGGGALTGALTLDGGSSGAVYTGSGSTITTTFTKINMPFTNVAGTQGVIQFGGANVLGFYGGVGENNVLLGDGAGAAAMSGSKNTGIGSQALNGITSGADNTALGYNALNFVSTGGNNTALGEGALFNLATGGNNIAIGNGAGANYTTSESSNILINSLGTATENNVIRIGTQGSGGGQQNTCFIAGIAGVTITSTAAVLVNTSTGQLGTVISSRRFKENIEDMGSVSRDIYKLRPVKFNFKGDLNESYGLIAEDVEEVAPYLVSYDKEGLPVTVRYHDLPALLLNEIQRLKLKIDELEGKLNARLR